MQIIAGKTIKKSNVESVMENAKISIRSGIELFRQVS